MSDPEVSPVRSLEPLPEQPPLAAPSDMHTAMYLMGNHPAKMVSLLALESFPPGEYIGRNMLAQRLEAMKEGADGWMPQPTTLLDYCRDNLGPLGFIDSIKPERPSGTKKDMPSGELRLSEKGRLLGPLVAGPLLSFELETLEADYDKNNLRLPLQVAMGKTYYAKGRLKGGPTRFSIYESLLRQPEGLPQAEVRASSGVSNSGLSVALQDLRNLGIVHKEEIQADSRIFILSEELAELNIGRVRAPESVAVLTALIRLQAEGHTKISGKRIFDSVAAARPEMSRRRMNWLFTKWRGNPNNAALVPEVRLSDRQYDRSHVAIVPEYQNYLSNLLGIRQMLGEDNPAAEAWRQAAREQAKDIAASPDHIARLLQLSKTHAACVNVPRDADWARDLAQFIPPEGIDAMELHRRVVDDQGKNIVYRAFCERLNRLDGIGVMERARLGQAQRPPNLVIKKHTFPKTWTNDAACKRLDPSLFSPLAGPGEVHPKVERQVEAAKSICHGCPVRLPCLRTAIDTREQQDVRGGVWFRRRQETPPQMTRMILDLVHVREGDEDDK